MRRVLTGLVPLAMTGAALFAATPAAVAAPSAAVHPAATGTCQPPYGPGSGCTATVTITVYPPGKHGTITISFTSKGFICGEKVTITAGNPSRVVATFTATCSGGAASVGNSPYQGVAAGTIQLPAGYGPGEHSLTALGTQSGVVGSSSFTLSSTSGNIVPCTASASNVQSSGIVLAAAYLSASCKTALPATAGGPPSSGSSGNAAISNGVGATNGVGASNGVAAVGTAASSSASQLPFTGFNAATVAASGAILVGAGASLVLVSRRRRRSAWQ